MSFNIIMYMYVYYTYIYIIHCTSCTRHTYASMELLSQIKFKSTAASKIYFALQFKISGNLVGQGDG